jgi:hypothetical protein
VPVKNVLAPVVTAAAILLLGGLAGVRAGGAARSFMASTNLSLPPLATAEPVRPASPPPPRLSERVFLVIVDGLRLRDSFGAPYLDWLRQQGIDAVATSHYPTISRPNYVAILTGVPPIWSGVRTNDIRLEVRLDSLMDRAHAAGLQTAFAADYTKSPAYMFTNDFDEIHYAPWPNGLVRATRTLVERGYPLVVLLPGEVDEVGHLRGGASQEYRDAVALVDRQLAEALAGIDLERDTVVVVADHGHTDRGGHGGMEPEVREVPLIMAGAGVRPGAALGDAELIDIAPTVAALLGLPAPGHGVGRTLTAAVLHDEEIAERLSAKDDLRIVRNRTIAELGAEQGRVRRANKRVLRLAAVTVFLVAGVMCLVAARRLGALHFDWRVLLVAVPAFPLAYYALVDLFGQRYSLSAVRDQSDLMRLLFRFGLASIVVYVLASWAALRGRVVLRDRLAAANALTLCAMFVAWVPASVMWAVYIPPFVDLPRSAMMILIPGTFIAVACLALATMILLGLEIVIFFARAVDPRLRLRRLERAAMKERQRLETEN